MKEMKKLLFMIALMVLLPVAAAAQTVNERRTYSTTGRTNTLDVFAGIPKYNGKPTMLNGYGLATAKDLGIAGKKYWNEFNNQAIEIELAPNTWVRYVTGTSPVKVKYLAKECRYKIGNEWVEWFNRLAESDEPAQPTTPTAPTNTTLTISKTATATAISAGGVSQFTVTVSNTGSVSAKGLKMKDSILSISSATVSTPVVASLSYTGTLSDMTFSQELPAGAQLTVTYSVTFATAGMSMTNVATACATNAGCVSAQVTVATAAPPAITNYVACPITDGVFNHWATLKEKLLGGKVALAMSVGIGAGASAAFSNHDRGEAAAISAVVSGVANRVGNFLLPNANRSVITLAGGQKSPELKKGESGNFSIQYNGASQNVTWTWEERRITILASGLGCMWSASPSQRFVLTPIPIIYRQGGSSNQPYKPVNGSNGGKKAPN